MSRGKRAGERESTARDRTLLWLAAGSTAALVAWGYLVYAAIDFGSSGRSGDDAAWWFLILASIGAVACLFLGLILLSRIGQRLGLIATPELEEPPPPRDPNAPRGGHRAGR
ncbi:MAG: hypothetical protein WB767_07735 [Nocardioides sp.]